MCTSIVEIAAAEGMAKREDEWFPLTHAVVAYDHARHALLADVITLDFVNEALPPGARAGVELTLESAKALTPHWRRPSPRPRSRRPSGRKGSSGLGLALRRLRPCRSLLPSHERGEKRLRGGRPEYDAGEQPDAAYPPDTCRGAECAVEPRRDFTCAMA